MPERVLCAAIDLGSNSFHMLVARLEHGELRVIDRIKEMVRIAGGIDEEGRLDPDTRQRALDCLSRFGQRIAGIPETQVRAVGTQAFRQLASPSSFLVVAETALGCPIDIISGREEARLVYLGVTQAVTPTDGRRLVIDIGGGSTELAIGESEDPIAAESVAAGCVTMTREAFSDGRITRRRWDHAVESVQSELMELSAGFRTLGWEQVVGSSGTIRAVSSIAEKRRGEANGKLALGDVEQLRDDLCRTGSIDALNLPGLSSRRQPVIAGGALILEAVMKSLEIDQLQASTYALREGLMHDLIGRLAHRDPRARSVAAMASRYQCDQLQAIRARDFAIMAAEQVREQWKLDAAHIEMLDWACQLHEVGLAISHEKHQLHGAYIVRHSDMPGFTVQEQQMLALLIGLQRRALTPTAIEEMPRRQQAPARRLLALLRLAVTLSRSRRDQDMPDFAMEAADEQLYLRLPAGWLEGHLLTARGLEYQARQLKSIELYLHLGELDQSEIPA